MKKVILVTGIMCMAMYTSARNGKEHGPIVNGDERAAGCSPSNEKLFIEFNNVRALIETAGSLWQDRANSNASYEIPIGSGNHCLYSGALWMGGEDVNGQLKLAAHRYRNAGHDFWAGPLGKLIAGSGNFDPMLPQNASITLYKDHGAAEIIPSTCEQYDKFFTVRRAEVEQYVLWWKCQNGEMEEDECEDVIAPDSEVIDRLASWPAHGNTGLGEDYYLAPFFDNNKDGHYNIDDGDYPWYDLNKEIDCRNDRRVTLYGDETHWWVFNDKGDIHTETGGSPIGMEIRAQAFTFATDDEINNMTFYNYELINRGTQTLYNTYFAQYADPDIGNPNDDYVGCDVGRGLGYCYNGPTFDPGFQGQPGYGNNVPAIGIDFFEGPYQDNDQQANPIGIYHNQALNGVGYGDGIVDNERFGMRRFVYYDKDGGNETNDPSSATHHYSYMKGLWKNNQPMYYGGNGFSNAPTTLQADFMFPGDSDTANWGTGGIEPGFDWSETSTGAGSGENQDGDRRFVQSAGPFTLKPGAINNITVGVVFGQSTSTDAASAISALKAADSKAQALFDNCFELVNPPKAPLLTIQEMENELILYLEDPPGQPLLDYFALDKINIKTPDDLIDQGIYYDDTFRFEGFQIFQMKNEVADVSQLGDLEFARLVAQCDVKNGVERIVNYNFDEELGLSFPEVMVDGADEGIKRSFRITEDQFATGDNKRLVNHKKYYYLAVSYAYNNFKTYDPTDPDGLDGQKEPYLRSRISSTGTGIKSVLGIPHSANPEADGTIHYSSYGYQPELTQIEGIGNGGTFLELTQSTIDDILADNKVDHPVYKSGNGPVDVKVIDPLSLMEGEYTIGFRSDTSDINSNKWWLAREWIDENNILQQDTIQSEESVGLVYEQLILDWGLSVTINQQYYDYQGNIPGQPGTLDSTFIAPIGATITFADSSKNWLGGIEDEDSFYPTNWIRSGSNKEAFNHTGGAGIPANPNPQCTAANWLAAPCNYDDYHLDKPDGLYEQLLGGTIAPFKLVGKGVLGMPFGYPGEDLSDPFYESNTSWFAALGNLVQNREARFTDLHDVDIYITSDRSKWSRCPVIEINDHENQTEHGDDILELRSDESVDQDGNPDGSGTGMGWFPGYAIDLNTGSRLNMMFAENSWLTGDNGDDMIWNPTSSQSDGLGMPLLGGMHYVYVFGEDVLGSGSGGSSGSPAYDEGEWLHTQMQDPGGSGSALRYRDVWKSCFWVFEPQLNENHSLLETDVKISVRINKPYEVREVNMENQGSPMYRFSIDQPTIVNDADRLLASMDQIKMVPNPYYGYSAYEQTKLDNRVKVTNIPERCEITIFNMQGALIRSFVKDDPLTSIDWDLKNHSGIPIAGGMYIVHIKVDIEGEEYEKILKWYGALRQPDLDNL